MENIVPTRNNTLFGRKRPWAHGKWKKNYVSSFNCYVCRQSPYSSNTASSDVHSICSLQRCLAEKYEMTSRRWKRTLIIVLPKGAVAFFIIPICTFKKSVRKIHDKTIFFLNYPYNLLHFKKKWIFIWVGVKIPFLAGQLCFFSPQLPTASMSAKNELLKIIVI